MSKIVLTAWLVILITGASMMPPGLAAPQTAATLEVGTSTLCAYHSIAAAIAAANPGDTIKVENVLFAGSPLVISKDLTLAGGYNSADPYSCLTLTGYNYTTVHRTGATADPILRVESAEVTITWFVFEDNGNGSGIQGDNATLNLENVIVRNNDDSGLYVYNGSNVNLSEVEVSGNSANMGGGLYADGYSHIVADNSVIRENDGWDSGAGVYVQGGATLTARNGTRINHNRTVWGCDRGGGIYATGADTQVLIDASEVVSNTALLQGGGLYISNGAEVTIQNGSWVQENIAYGPAALGGGGGAYVEGSDSTLNVYDSVFLSNWADPDGGGVWNEFGALDLNDVAFIANNAAQKGGGLYTSFGPTTIQRSQFVGNVATYDSGGAIATYRAALSAHSSQFVGNTADAEGSAIFVQGTNGIAEPVAEIVNCYLTDNGTTARDGKGPPAAGSTLYVEGTSATITHNTLAHETQQASFGVFVGDGAMLTMVDNILSGFYIGIRRLSAGTGTAVSSYDLFYNNAYNYDTAGITVNHAVYGDPAFVGFGDYHLTALSAAIDAGADAGVFVDYDGASRPWGAGFDIGADEYPPRVRAFLPLVVRGY